MLPWDDDRKLAAEIAQGNERAAELFDIRHRAELESLARLKGLSEEDAKDAAQDTIIAIITLIREGRFRAESSLRTLLISILRRKIVDFYRQQDTEKTVPLEAPSSGEQTALTRAEEIGLVHDPNIKLAVEDALRSMPEDHRIIFILNRMVGLSIEEISSVIRRSRGAVGRILAEAQKMLRKKLC